MIKTTYKGWRILFNGDETLYTLMDDIIENKYPRAVVQTLKNNSRSLVFLVDVQGQKAILKSPREKNTKKWIRFTTWYRPGEAFKTVRNLEKLQQLGFNTNTPLMAMEKRCGGMVVDSWVLYGFKTGKPCDASFYPSIVETLQALHDKNRLHGDAHVENFLTNGHGIITIDANLKRPVFGSISKYTEWLYLLKSAPAIATYLHLPENDISFRIAKTYSRLYWSWRHSKKKRRRKRKTNLHILVIRLSSIGDIILTTPVLGALKKKYPDAVIHFLVMDTYQDAISGNPHVDRLILFEKRKYRGVSGIYRFSRTLKDTRYDLIIDLHAKIRSRLISIFVPGRVFRYKKRALWKSILVPLRLRRYQVDDTIVRSYFKPLEKLFVYYTDETLRFDFEPQTLEKIRSYTNAVVMAPGAANNTKQWPAAYWAELGGMMTDPIVLIGGKDEYDLCEEIRRTIGNRCVNLAGKLSLKESGALISVSKYVITNDSGPFHIARGTGKKVFVIFGPTDPNMFTYDENAVLIHAGTPCSPCSLHGDKTCPRGHFDCMKSLTPEKVHEIISGWFA